MRSSRCRDERGERERAQRPVRLASRDCEDDRRTLFLTFSCARRSSSRCTLSRAAEVAVRARRGTRESELEYMHCELRWWQRRRVQHGKRGEGIAEERRERLCERDRKRNRERRTRRGDGRRARLDVEQRLEVLGDEHPLGLGAAVGEAQVSRSAEGRARVGKGRTRRRGTCS